MDRQWLIETLSAVQPSQQNYQTQSYTTQPPQQTQPQQARYQPSQPIKQDPRLTQQLPAQVQQQTPAKPAPTPTPAQNSPVVPGANPPPPECNGENVESAESDGKKRHWYKQRGRVSKAEKVSRRNLKLSKILQPKNAVMILNELVKGCQYTIDELPCKIDANQFRASVSFEEQEFAGTGRTKAAAKNSAAETALKYLVKNKRLSFKKEASESGEAGEGADEKMEIGEEDGTQVMPWSHIASFAMYKLFSTWGEEPTITNRTQEVSSPIPKAVGAVQTGRTELKPAKKMPDNPEKMNPLMLMNLMLPHAQWDEVGKGGLVPNVVFTFNVTVDGKQFTGTGTNKKSAKKLAAFAACHQILNINYPGDVWAVQPSQQNYQTQSYTTQPPQQTQPQQARYQQSQPIKQDPRPTQQLPAQVQQQTPAKPAPTPTPAQNSPVVPGANPPPPECDGENVESAESDGKKRHWYKQRGRVSKAEKVSRRNLKLSKILQPKIAAMILNDLVKGCQYTIDELPWKIDANQFRASVSLEEQEFAGTGRTKAAAKNSAAEIALKYLVKKKRSSFKKEASESGEAGEGADEKMEIGEEDGKQVMPWSHIASFAMYKLFSTWGEEPTTTNRTQELSSPIPKAVGAVQTGRIELKPAKKMPDNPEKMNPLMLMNLMLPHAQWDEVGKSGLVSNEVFTFNVTVDGKQFTGTGTNKKSAKKLAAFAACHQILNINYPGDVWAVQPSQQNYQTQSYTTQPPQQTQPQQARYQQSQPIKQDPRPTQQLPAQVQQQTPAKPAPTPTPAQNSPVVPGANPPPPECNGENVESAESDGKKRHWYKQRGRVSKAEKVSRRNLKLSKILQPKIAAMILNELVKGCQYTIDELPWKIDANQFRASVSFEEQEFAGTGRTKSAAKNSAAETALKYLVKNKRLSFKKEASESGEAGEGANVKMEIGEEDGTQVMPWSQIASFAKYKLFSTWGEEPTTTNRTQELSSPIPKAVGAVQTGRTELKSARKMPDNPEKMNPLMLMDLMLPHAQWDEVGKSGLVSNEVFTFNVTVDGKQFTGTGTNKKSAKNLAAFAACHQILNINYPDDVWTQELSSPIPKAVGAVQTGRTELKSARKMPDNPEKMNPLMLMDLMLPHAQWDEVGKSGLVPNVDFTFNVTVDGKQFTGTGTNKKSAKNLAAFAACHQILNINYPDDVWTQELSSPIPKAVGAVQTGRTELKSARKMPDNPEKMNPLMLMDLMLPHAQWDEVGKSGLVPNVDFTFNVTVDGKQFTGTGTNKKSAKNLAAFAACHQILNINYPDDVWTQELSSPIPKAVGAFQTGRTELKPVRKMPDNPEKMNPLMLMDLMLPHAQWDEVGKSGLVSNEVFTFNVTVDGKQFTGTGTNKKSAKKLAAFAACHQILNINYPDDVWVPLY